MVTWTFNLLALFVGFAVGLLLGGLLFAFMETKDGGAWAKGFFEGCEKRALISYLEHEKERMRGSTNQPNEVNQNEID